MVLSGVTNIKHCVADARKRFVRFPDAINLFDLRSGAYEYCFTL